MQYALDMYITQKDQIRRTYERDRDDKPRLLSSQIDVRNSHPLFAIWQSMMECAVCERWRKSFWLFVMDMGPKPVGHKLARVNPDKQFDTRNCVWEES